MLLAPWMAGAKYSIIVAALPKGFPLCIVSQQLWCRCNQLCCRCFLKHYGDKRIQHESRRELTHSSPRGQVAMPVVQAMLIVIPGKAIAQNMQVLQRKPGADGNTVRRLIGDVAGYACYLGEQFIDPSQHRAAAGHDHAFIDNI